MKILVLGSNGFIGSNALLYFRSKYPETYGCDVFSPKNFDEKFFLLDKNIPRFDKIFIQNTFDICINASGSGNVDYSIRYPDEDYRLNAKNVFDILSAIGKFNSRCRFLNFSSAAVYGNPVTNPVSEKSRTKPVSPYGFHKLISEQICSEFYHLNKVRTCSLRVFSAYGEGLRKQLFWDVYQKSKENKVVELFGTGEETRDFIHVSDVMVAIDCILQKSPFDADVINVATGKSETVQAATKIFLKAIGKNADARFMNVSKSGDPIFMMADVCKLAGYGFSPAVNLEEGLTVYAEWILANES